MVCFFLGRWSASWPSPEPSSMLSSSSMLLLILLLVAWVIAFASSPWATSCMLVCCIKQGMPVKGWSGLRRSEVVAVYQGEGEAGEEANMDLALRLVGEEGVGHGAWRGMLKGGLSAATTLAPSSNNSPKFIKKTETSFLLLFNLSTLDFFSPW